MYYRIAKRNLTAQKSRTILTTIGVAIGTASLLGIVAFSNGLRTTVIESITSQGSLTQITVQPKSQEGGFLQSLTSSTVDVLTPASAEQIRQIPHVKAVYPQLSFKNISSLRVNIWGQSFQTDTMIFGIPFEFLENELPEGSEWQNQSEPYPAIISQRIIDLYNLTVAPTNDLPNFSEKDIIGLEFTILPGRSTFFPQLSSDARPVKAKIVGFSPKVDLIGVTLPIEAVRELNQIDPRKENYSKLFVEVDEEKNVAAVSNDIENMGTLITQSAQAEIQIFEQNFRIITVGLSLISTIILFISGLTIANTFLSSVNERRHEIGIMRALGARRGDIQKIFLSEASFLGLIGGVTGVFFAWIGGFIVDAIALDAFPEISTKPDTFLIYDIWTIIGIVAFAIGLSLIFAFLPATKAANLRPLEALTE